MLTGALGPAIGMWTLMVIAMMLPATLPAVRHVAHNRLRWRRRRATVTFVAVYLGIWGAFGAPLVALSPLWSAAGDHVRVVVALTLAVAWQLTPLKRRALLDCHLPSPLPPRGPRATAGVIRFALRNGTACVRSCWAMMVAMALASSGALAWTLLICAIVTTEKLAQRPRRATRAGAAVPAGAAVLSVVF
jgi:predicted metal-binding membrane protein